MCLWLGALSDDQGKWCDEGGWLTGEGLKRWFHYGYSDSRTWEKILWRDVLIRIYGSGNFWKDIETYSTSLSLGSLRSIGGKFPNWISAFAAKIKWEGETKISIDELLDWLWANRNDFVKHCNAKWYLSEEWLKKWCMEWYTDPVTDTLIFWKDVLLWALYAPSFWNSFSRYARNLDKFELSRIWWKIPPNPASYEPIVRNAGFTEFNVRNVCMSLWALSPEMAKYTDEVGGLSPEWLKRWYSEWYIDPDTHEKVTGRTILIYAKRSTNFWQYLREYARQLDLRHSKLLGGKFPKEKTSFAERIFGSENMNIQSFLEFLSNGNTNELQSIESEANLLNVWDAEKFLSHLSYGDSLSQLGTEPSIPQPKFSNAMNLLMVPIGSTVIASKKKSISKSTHSKSNSVSDWLGYTQVRIQTTFKKLALIFEDSNRTMVLLSDFDSRILPDHVEIFCTNPKVYPYLKKFRTYIDETLMSEMSEGMEHEFLFVWK